MLKGMHNVSCIKYMYVCVCVAACVYVHACIVDIQVHICTYYAYFVCTCVRGFSFACHIYTATYITDHDF